MDPTTGEVKQGDSEVERLYLETQRLEAELTKFKATQTVKVRQSETMGKLALALSKAQGAMEDAKKDAKNPFYNSKYADLASVWSAVRKPLADNEIAVFARVLEASSTKVTVETMLRHSSDEWYLTEVTVPITAISKDREKVVLVTAQHIGSGITYCRRYGLQCVTGNAPAEDDGNQASGVTAHNETAAAAGVARAEEGPPPASTPPQARAATAADYGERTKLQKEITDATDEKTLAALVDRISKLPGDQKAELRKQYGLRLKAVKAAPAAKTEAPAAAEEKKEAPAPVPVTHFPEPGSEG